MKELPRVKFFIIPPNYYKGEYQHESICLAEGFQELGVEFYGVNEYWFDLDTGKYLIQKAPHDFKADIHIYNQYYLIHFPEESTRVDYSLINILIDVEDGLYSAYSSRNIYSRFNLILRSHFNKKIKYSAYHPNIQPWAFGLSKRIMNQIDKTQDSMVKDQVLINYRVNQSIRDLALEQFTPPMKNKYKICNYTTDTSEQALELFSKRDLSFWTQTNKRHDPRYYELLNESLLTYAFGGFLHIKPFATNRINRQLQIYYELKKNILEKTRRDTSDCYLISQFDSWRWWEALYSNTCPIHMNFEDWNWVLPEMPLEGVHYWGVKRFEFEQSATKLLALSRQEILEIGKKGRSWVSEHYSPVAVAKRFLRIMNSLK